MFEFPLDTIVVLYETILYRTVPDRIVPYHVTDLHAKGASINTITKRRFHMRYRLLGNSGLRVSEAALGALTFGEESG